MFDNAAAVTLTVVSIFGPSPAPPDAHLPAPATTIAAASTSGRPVGPEAPVNTDPRYPVPDAVADYTGGVAARVRTEDGQAIAGGLFLLMATAGSAVDARLYDGTPFTHDNEIPGETIESNSAAAATVGAIMNTAVPELDLTTAPGGGASGGITYAIAYLDLLTDGAFTDGLRVAATGRLGRNGYVNSISAITEKTAAAHLAGADVLFTSVVPPAEVAVAHAARTVGEMFRARNTSAPLAEERLWTDYESWGGTRPVDGMDIVGVRHVGDIAAYVCGAGSETACSTLALIDDSFDQPTADAPVASDESSPSAAETTAPVR